MKSLNEINTLGGALFFLLAFMFHRELYSFSFTVIFVGLFLMVKIKGKNKNKIKGIIRKE